MAAEVPTSTENPAAPIGAAEVIATLKGKAVTAGKEQGFFIPTKVLNTAEKAIFRLASVHTGEAQQAEIDKALKDLALMREKADKAQARLEEVNQNRDKLAVEHKQAVDALSILRGEGPKSIRTAEKLNREYKQQLDVLQKELGQAKLEGKKAARGFDPDVAIAANLHEETLRTQVKTFQKERKEMEKTLAEAKCSESAAAKLASSHLEVLTKLNSELAQLKSRKALAMASGPLKALDIKIRTPVVNALIGAKGIAWLKKIDLQSRENMRDYAHHLMQAANSSKATKGLGDLLHYVWVWLKSKAYAAREVLRPWVERIHRDLSSGCLQAVKVYREALEDIVADFKLQKKSAETRYANKPKWQVDLVASIGTVLAQAKKSRSRLERFFSAVKSLTSRVFTWVKGFLPRGGDRKTSTAAEDATLFDSDNHITMEDVEDEDLGIGTSFS